MTEWLAGELYKGDWEFDFNVEVVIDFVIT